jgi:hypothetical protein
VRSLHEYEEADRYFRWGLNDREIARLTGIPRGTVQDWRRKGFVGRLERSRAKDCPICGSAALAAAPYAYLLGLYLGDGCLSLMRRHVYRLRVVLDAKYPNIINECAAAIADVRPSARVDFVKQDGCIEVSAYWKHWPCLFPQHGPGRKHERKIALSGWQRRIADRHPERLLRGLIHSDGCRVSNRILDKYEYPRYQFTNHSPDIRAVFCAACDRARIPWRQSNAVTISVSRRQAVATMDEFIGPKS